MQTVARSQKNRRTQFLFIYSYVVQFLFMFWLSKDWAAPILPASTGGILGGKRVVAGG